jgi:hypothetical protein
MSFVWGENVEYFKNDLMLEAKSTFKDMVLALISSTR